jgi:hypothetical protein
MSLAHDPRVSEGDDVIFIKGICWSKKDLRNKAEYKRDLSFGIIIHSAPSTAKGTIGTLPVHLEPLFGE